MHAHLQTQIYIQALETLNPKCNRTSVLLKVAHTHKPKSKPPPVSEEHDIHHKSSQSMSVRNAIKI